MGKVYLLNALVTPLPQNVKDGLFYVKRLSPREFRKKFWDLVYEGRPIESAVGHSATAEFLSELLGYPVKFQRRTIHFAKGDIGLVVKLNGRASKEKTLPEIRRMFDAKKVSFYLIERLL